MQEGSGGRGGGAGGGREVVGLFTAADDSQLICQLSKRQPLCVGEERSRVPSLGSLQPLLLPLSIVRLHRNIRRVRHELG